MINVERLEYDVQKFKAAGWYPTSTDVGGYPIYYITRDDDFMCPKCANNRIKIDTDTESVYFIELYAVNWDNTALFCDVCSTKINSAYGETDDV